MYAWIWLSIYSIYLSVCLSISCSNVVCVVSPAFVECSLPPRLPAGFQQIWLSLLDDVVSSSSCLLSCSEVFCDAEGNILKENSTIYFRKLADTFEAIANHGPDAFYDGPIADRMVQDIEAAGRVIFCELWTWCCEGLFIYLLFYYSIYFAHQIAERLC